MRKLIVAVFVVLCVIGIWKYCAGSRSVDPEKIKNLVTHYDDVFKQHLAQVNREIGNDIVRYEPIAPGVIPRKVTIKGTHRETGRWIGLVAKNIHGEAGPDRLRRKPDAEEMNQRIVAMYESIYPPYLDLVRGLAATFDLTLDEIDLQYVEHRFFLDLWLPLLDYKQFYELTDFSMGSGSQLNCSLMSYYNADEGRHLIGRNFDNASDRPYFVVNTDLHGVNRTLGCSCYFLYHWITDGINDKGLFIGVATNESPSAYNEKEPNYPDEPAVQMIHMVRIALEKCATVEEVIELFGSVRIWFPNEVNHLLVADEAGNAAVVEFDLDRKMVVFRRKEPYMILTNYAYQEGTDNIRDHCPRFRNAEAAVTTNAPLPDMESVREITRIMRSELVRITQGNSRTLWTSYFDIQARQMELRLRSEEYQVAYTYTLDIP